MNQWYILWNKDKNALGYFPYKKRNEEEQSSEPEELYQVSDSWKTRPKVGLSVLRFIKYL